MPVSSRAQRCYDRQGRSITPQFLIGDQRDQLPKPTDDRSPQELIDDGYDPSQLPSIYFPTRRRN